MKAIRLLALRRLRLQPLRAVVAIGTIAAGVSLGAAVLVVTSSVDTSVRDGVRAYAGPTELRVVGPTTHAGILASTVDAVAKTDGVAAAVPMVQAITYAVTPDGKQLPVIALGVDCSVQALVGDVGCNPAAFGSVDEGPLLIAPSLAARLGGAGTLRTDTGRVSLAGATALPALDRLNEGSALVMPMPRAQHIFGRGAGVDVVYVQAKPGSDLDALETRLQQRVGPQNGVLRADEPPAVIAQTLRSFLPIFTLLALLTLAIGGVLVHNTVRLSMAERRRQQAIVAALGGGNRTLAGGPIVEAGLLGLVGGLIGAGLGILIAHPILSTLGEFTQKAAGIQLDVVVQPSTIVICVVLGIAVGALSALRPVRQSLRADVAAELSNRDARADAEVRNQVPRAVGWSAITVLGLGLCALTEYNGSLERWQAALGPPAFLIAVVGNLLLGAALAPIVVAVLSRRLRTRKAAARLALTNLVGEPSRTSVMVIALSMALGVAVVTSSFNASINQAIRENLTKNLHGVLVSAHDDNSNAFNLDATLSPDALAKLAALPGVGAVHRAAGLTVGHSASDVVAVTAFEDPWLDAAVYEGSKDRTRFDTGMALIGPALSRNHDLHPGESIDLATPSGIVQVPILGVIDNGDFGGGAVILPYDLLTSLYGPQPSQNVTVDPKPGVSIDELLGQIRSANIEPDLFVKTSDQVAAEDAKQIANQLSTFWVLQRALLLMAFVAVLSTLLLVGLQRQRQLGLLAAVGMTPKEIARMVVAEALFIGGVGVVLGAISSVVMYGGMLLIAPLLVGYHDPFVIDYGTMAVYAVVTIAIAALAAWWPARRAARVEVLQALRYE